jgi:alpha-L-fucosidase
MHPPGPAPIIETTMTPSKLSLKSLLCLALTVTTMHAQVGPQKGMTGSRNKPDRMEWYRDQGFGMFIHWGVDSQLGVVISHSLVGASDDYTNRFFNDLPKTFNPTRFDAGEWARVAKIAGVKYVMFTTKHHSGFTMYHTKTTPFSIENTPFKRDITAEVYDAFRSQGIAAGVYFSPDDFWWLHQHNIPIRRLVPETQPSRNPGLLAYDKAQLTELLTQYGPIDLAYFDGEADDLRETAWDLNPNLVITRGVLETPELTVPSSVLVNPWETSMTMGTAWQYQPDNEVYKSGRDLIRLLFQTRAKGGNMLLNIGPMPNGQLAIEQENRLREMGLWMFVNSECIYGVRPWVVMNESNIWFTQKKNNGPLYAIVDSDEVWPKGTWKELVLHSVRATAGTTISVLGQDDKTVEYSKVIPKSTFTQMDDGLHIRVNRAQRLQDNSKWPNATVIKLTGVKPALVPPRVVTDRARNINGVVTFNGTLVDMGDAKSLEAGFEYRPVSGEDVHARSTEFKSTELKTVTAKGAYSIELRGLPPGMYEFHAIARHPLMTLYGADKIVR